MIRMDHKQLGYTMISPTLTCEIETCKSYGNSFQPNLEEEEKVRVHEGRSEEFDRNG